MKLYYRQHNAIVITELIQYFENHNLTIINLFKVFKNPIAFIFCLLCALSLHSQNTFYVNQNVQGGLQNGNDWHNAFLDLQQALAVSGAGDTIWVAKGIYYPTNGIDRNISFVLRNGVHLYGGFAGTESDLTQRDFQLNITTLSGNIGAPPGNDNSYHVLLGAGLDSTTVLDGFVVSGGMANGSGENDNGGGLLLLPSPDVYLSAPIIQHCRFEFNFALYGGAIHSFQNGLNNTFLNPAIRKCQFVSNRAIIQGGAIALEGASLPEYPLILEDCLLSENSCFAGEGGGIYLLNAEHHTFIRRCTFEKDSANLSLGGAIFFALGLEKIIGANMIIDSCIFIDNIATEGGGLFYRDVGLPGSTPPFKAMISNCQFYKNIATNGLGATYYFMGYNQCDFTIDVVNSLFKDNLTSSNCITMVEGGTDSVLKLHYQNCQYFNNYRTGTDNRTYPIIFGTGGDGGKVDAVIENCLFSKNGGGISSVCSESGGRLKTIINNCTFYDNDHFIINKSIYPNFNGVDNYVETYVSNCIIWQPGTTVYDMFHDNNVFIQKLDGYHVDHTLVSLDSFIVANYPIFGDHVLSKRDPLFEDSTSGDFHLRPCSPAVNSGDNAVVDTLGLTTDLEGRPRIAGSKVDMGAYETQDSCLVSNMREAELDLLLLNPNPVGRAGQVVIHNFQGQSVNLRWIIWDIQGRKIMNGQAQVFQGDEIQLKAPDTSGIYWIELFEHRKTKWLKLVVQ